ncbi:MAG TPA: benzoylformate decarboxylase [Steroidobacteraceae bacterium]|nr:benzoylformate decarboxylase [Steroidobacteraceae bacterium]
MSGHDRQTHESTVREAVFALLRAFRLTTIFGNPGSTELPMFRDFPADFRYVLALQESIAVGMADGFAQGTRNAALVSLHSAVGVGHALGNIFTAYRNQTPLVIVAGQQARSMLPYEPFLYSERAAEFPQPYVKWAVEPARAADVPAAIARAYHVAMQAPRGPTLVSVPVDDWQQHCAAPAPRVVSERVGGEPAALDDIAVALAGAARPVFVAGAGVARDDAWDEIIALAELHDAPVWTAPMAGRNVFPGDHRLFAGYLPADRARIVAALDGADFVLVLGAPAFTYHVEGDGPFVPAGAALALLTDNPAQAAWAPVGRAVVTDLKLGLRALLDGPAPVARSRATARAGSPPAARAAPPAGRLTDAYLLQRIAALRPPGTVLVEEAPGTRGAMHRHLPILERDGFYTCASGGLGFALPAAAGIALARPRARIIALLGDGSSMYSIQALWSVAQLGLPIVFIVVNNGRYEALHQFKSHFDLPTLPGTELPGLDFVGLANAQGIDAVRVGDAAALDAALGDGFSFSRPLLVEVLVGS